MDLSTQQYSTPTQPIVISTNPQNKKDDNCQTQTNLYNDPIKIAMGISLIVLIIVLIFVLIRRKELFCEVYNTQNSS